MTLPVPHETAELEDAAAQLLHRATALLPGGGETRPGQAEMVAQVARAQAAGQHLVIAAGTGTGKSLGYLVPSVLSGKKVVVATATRALQDQLATKDLPLVTTAHPGTVTYQVLKGRSNYLCLQRVHEIGGSGLAGPEAGAGATRGDRSLSAQVAALVRWADHTPTGDRADLDFDPSPRAWDAVSVGARECPGAQRCPAGARCFAEAARTAAAAADVVVVNMHLYGAHVASGGTVIPEHDLVVFDEAHQLEEIMTACLGLEVAPGRLRAVAAMARPLIGTGAGRAPAGTMGSSSSADLGAGLAETADRLRDLLDPLRGTQVLVGQNGARGPADAAGHTELVWLLDRGRQLVADLRDALRTVDQTDRLLDAGSTGGSIARAIHAAARLEEDLHHLATLGTAEHASAEEVAWVDGAPGSPVLRVSPVDVGPSLDASVWSAVPAVLTSATIPPGLATQVGLAADTTCVDVGSPFDYRSHALLYVPRDLPDRRSPGAEQAIHAEIKILIAAAGGRTLALFTSHRAMLEAAQVLRPCVPQHIWVQGDLPKNRLVQAYADDESSCLFATMGYWQGIDVPGRSSILVVVDRIPFPRPDHPLLSARRAAAGTAAFRSVDLPHAATMLAQGAGRLVRTAADRGVVAVLDSRLATAGYRSVLLDALPPLRRTVSRSQVIDYLQQCCTEEDPLTT